MASTIVSIGIAVFVFVGYRYGCLHKGRWQTPFAYTLIGYQYAVLMLGCAMTFYFNDEYQLSTIH